MKIPEILLVGTAHQGRSPAEVNAEINELANPDFRSRIDALPTGPKRGAIGDRARREELLPASLNPETRRAVLAVVRVAVIEQMSNRIL